MRRAGVTEFRNEDILNETLKEIFLWRCADLFKQCPLVLVIRRKGVYFESFILLSGLSINSGLLFTVLHLEGKCFCGKKKNKTLISQVNLKIQILEAVIELPFSVALAWVSVVSGGKEERWKRKRERAEGEKLSVLPLPAPPSKISSPLAP